MKKVNRFIEHICYSDGITWNDLSDYYSLDSVVLDVPMETIKIISNKNVEILNNEFRIKISKDTFIRDNRSFTKIDFFKFYEYYSDDL